MGSRKESDRTPNRTLGTMNETTDLCHYNSKTEANPMAEMPLHKQK